MDNITSMGRGLLNCNGHVNVETFSHRTAVFPACSHTIKSSPSPTCVGPLWVAPRCKVPSLWFGQAEVRLLNMSTVLRGHSASRGHRDIVQVRRSLTDGMGIQSIMGCRFSLILNRLSRQINTSLTECHVFLLHELRPISLVPLVVFHFNWRENAIFVLGKYQQIHSQLFNVIMHASSFTPPCVVS